MRCRQVVDNIGDMITDSQDSQPKPKQIVVTPDTHSKIRKLAAENGLNLMEQVESMTNEAFSLKFPGPATPLARPQDSGEANDVQGASK